MYVCITHWSISITELIRIRRLSHSKCKRRKGSFVARWIDDSKKYWQRADSNCLKPEQLTYFKEYFSSALDVKLTKQPSLLWWLYMSVLHFIHSSLCTNGEHCSYKENTCPSNSPYLFIDLLKISITYKRQKTNYFLQ